MLSQTEIYSEIVRTISRVLSGVSLALASFISIAFVLALDVPGNVITIGGYSVIFTPTLALLSASLSVSFLAFSCLSLFLLPLIGPKNDSSNDD